MSFFLEAPEKIVKFFENDQTIYTSESHPQEIDFIESALCSQKTIGLCSIPGRFKKNHKRDLEKDLKRVKEHYKIDTVVTLVKSKELDSMGISNYFEKVKEFELTSYHFPIKDKWLPDSEGLYKCVDFILKELKDGKKVVIHCNGGKGRCATVLACVLMVQEGYSFEKSVDIIKSTRKGTLRNPFQNYYLSNFHENYKIWSKEKKLKINCN